MIDFDFHKYVEKWCMVYKPMQHTPNGENQRFFITESFYAMNDFAKTLDPDLSPVCIMESGENGMLNPYDKPEYTVYFFARADEQNSGREALAAKREALRHMKKFIAFLRHQKEDVGDERLRNLEIDNLTYQYVGPLYTHWYGVYVTLTDTQKFNACTAEDDYVAEFEYEEPEPEDNN